MTGTMRLYSLFQLPTMDVLENRVKRGLQQYGWGYQSVSIKRNSYLNNTLEVTIVITALGNDISRRILDGITNFLKNFSDGVDNLFKDVSLRISHDTGAEVAATTVPPSSKNIPTIVPPNSKFTPTKVVKLKPVTSTKTVPTIDAGVLTVVTVKADSNDNQMEFHSVENDTKDKNSNSGIDSTWIVVGALFVVLILRRI